MSEQVEQWQQERREVSIEEMTEAVKNLRAAKDAYDEQKALSDSMYAEYKNQQNVVAKLMQEGGLDEYTVKGFGKVFVKEELSVRTPKSPEQKAAFFAWVRENMGTEAANAYMSVNSSSLNSLYRQKVEEYGARGELLSIDGLEEPTSYTKLTLRKA